LCSTDLPNVMYGEDNVCVFWHALALDEHRVKFLPEYHYHQQDHKTLVGFSVLFDAFLLVNKQTSLYKMTS
jgi:Uncharacterized alpha/beta hydrolase domain (DUF2235)